MSLNPLRSLPSVNDLIESPPLRRLVDRLSRNVVVSAARALLEETRQEVQHAAAGMTLPSVSDLAERVARRILDVEAPPLRPVINATGRLLDSGLGRAPLCEEAVEEIAAVARGYASLDLDLTTGQPSPRNRAVAGLFAELTGAEAALVVNSQSGAVVLATAALAAGRDVLVSRGQMLSSGDGFRLPEALAAAGAVAREVGTTNQTTAQDFAAALDERSAAILVAEPVGYRISGLVEEPSIAQLAPIARQRGIPLVHGLGWATLTDLAPWGIAEAPVVGDALRGGADLVLLGGEMLLGGPQCGIVLGRKTLIGQLERHALGRALRPGMLTLVALGATLRLYRDPQQARRAVPLLSLLATSAENLRNRAERLAPQLGATEAVAAAEAVAGQTPLLPVAERPLETWRISLRPKAGSAERLAARLRAGAPALVGRVEDDRLLLDLRSVLPRQDLEILAAIEAQGGSGEG